jgi:hypothetical protein
MDPQPAAPLLSPTGRCFHCAAEVPVGANFCPACGAVPGLTAENEKGYIAYLLAAVDDWTRARLIGPSLAARMTAPYRARLGIAAADLAPRSGAAPAAPRQPVNFTVVWANALLYLGAFFVVIATIFFLLLIGNDLARTAIMAVLSGLFFATGFVARRVAIVRSAGVIFTGVGALMAPIVLLAFVNWLREAGPVPDSQLWLFASIACFLLYLAFTLARFGIFYTILTLLAFSAMVQSAFAVASPPEVWLGAWWGAEALVLVAVHVVLGRWLRPTFGPLALVWALLWASVSFMAGVVAAFASPDPAPSLWSFLFLFLSFALMAWRLGDIVSPALAGMLVHLVSAQTVNWAEGPEWVGSLAAIAIATGQIAFWWWRRGTIAGREQLVLGVVVAVAALFPPIFDEVKGIGAVAGLAVTALLAATAVLTRRAWLLALPALTLFFGWGWLLAALLLGIAAATNVGLGYLVLVVGLAGVALALPLRLHWWRWSVAIMIGAYAGLVAVLTFDQPGPAAIAAWVMVALAGAFVARWRNPWLLAAVAVVLVGAVAASLRWLRAPVETAGPLFAALGIAWVLAGHALGERVARWSLAARLVGLTTALFAVLVAGVAEVDVFGEDRRRLAGHLTSLTIAILALLLALEARWRRLALYPATFAALCAALWELAVFEVANAQWYAVPAGLYFTVVAVLSARDRELGTAAPVFSSLGWVVGALVLGLTTLGQTFGEEPLVYGIVLLVECFALLGVGVVVRNRALLGTTVLLMVLAGLRLLFAEPGLIPFVLCFAGVALLAVGVAALVIVGRRRARAGPPGDPPAAPPIASADPL